MHFAIVEIERGEEMKLLLKTLRENESRWMSATVIKTHARELPRAAAGEKPRNLKT